MVMHKFSDIAHNITLKKMPELGDEKNYIGLEHLDTGNLYISRYGSSVALKGEKLVMHKGDILFGRRNTYLRRAAIAPHDGIFSAHGMIFRPNTSIIDEKFFPFFIQSNYFMDKAIQISVGSLSPTVNWGKLKDLEFELPNIEKQQELAELLWAAEETKQKYMKLLNKTNKLEYIEYLECFGGIHNPKYKVLSLDDICEIIKDGTHYTPQYTEDKENGFKFLSSKDVITGKIDWENTKYIPKDLHLKLHERIAPKYEDILLAKNGTTGIAALVDRNDIFDIYVSLCLLRIKKDYDVNYVLKVINLPDTKQQFDSHLRGIGVPNLHISEIKKVKLIIPPLVEQKKYTMFVNKIDKMKCELDKLIIDLDSFKKGLLNQVFTKEVSHV